MCTLNFKTSRVEGPCATFEIKVHSHRFTGVQRNALVYIYVQVKILKLYEQQFHLGFKTGTSTYHNFQSPPEHLFHTCKIN